MAVALVFRLILSTQAIVHQPDEVWQYLEPAYGLVTGRWIVAWEFHSVIRGWLVPMMLYPVVALGHFVAPTSQFHIWLVRLVLSVLSLGVVAACYQLGSRVSRQHGLMAGWVAAIWTEIFYFAPRSSGEAIAVSLLMPAIALLYRLRERPDFRIAVAAGCLLVLGAIVRFQYLPAVALIAAGSGWGGHWAGDRGRRLWLPLLLGNGVALAMGGMADMLGGQRPFLWIYTNYTINMAQQRSALFGTMAPGWYISQILTTWGWCSLVLVPSVIVGVRRFPLLLAAALVIIAVHMLVPHKEYRFVLLAVVLLVLLAAVGSVDVAQWLVQRYPRYRKMMMAMLGGVWLAMSVTVAVCNPFVTYWGRGRSSITTLAEAGQRPDICGLAYFLTPSQPRAAYVYFNRNLPILLFEGPIAGAAATANQQRFNVIIAPRLAEASLSRAYRLDHCMPANKPAAKQQNCTYVRPGMCSGGAGDFDYNAVLTRLGH